MAIIICPSAPHHHWWECVDAEDGEPAFSNRQHVGEQNFILPYSSAQDTVFIALSCRIVLEISTTMSVMAWWNFGRHAFFG
jgi:hypothetical protein